MKSDQLNIVIAKGHVSASNPLSYADGEINGDKQTSASGGDANNISTKQFSTNSVASASNGPVCRYLNVELCNTKPAGGSTGNLATILLENPQGDFPISLHELKNQVTVKLRYTFYRIF